MKAVLLLVNVAAIAALIAGMMFGRSSDFHILLIVCCVGFGFCVFSYLSGKWRKGAIGVGIAIVAILILCIGEYSAFTCKSGRRTYYDCPEWFLIIVCVYALATTVFNTLLLWNKWPGAVIAKKYEEFRRK